MITIGSKIEKLDFELSGELTMDQTNCADKIVLIRTNLPVEIAVKDLQEKGAKGVVVLSFVYSKVKSDREERNCVSNVIIL